jgi:hypothetical protein
MRSIIANLLAIPCQQKRIKRYRHFISTDNEDIDKIFEKKKWPSIIGSERFMDLIKEKFFLQKVDDEIPQSKGRHRMWIESKKWCVDITELTKMICCKPDAGFFTSQEMRQFI